MTATTPATPTIDTDQPYTTVFTDGSSTGGWGPVGWAWAVIEGAHAGEWDSGGWGWGTNQTAEVWAAYQAMLALPGLLLVVTDSEYAMKSMTEWQQGWRLRSWRGVKNADILRPAADHFLERAGEVRYAWVPGHSGVEGNEEADRLAGDARRAVPRDQWGPPDPAARAIYDAEGGHTANGKATQPPRPTAATTETGRHYTPERLGPDCRARCGTRIPRALATAGIYVHPTCTGARR